jgi:hypothetical protein
MAKSYVLTNSKKLDAFIRMGGKINDIGMVVGQLTGKPKYPKGHVGRKSRDRSRVPVDRIHPKERARRARIRALTAQLKGMGKSERKEARKQMVLMLKAEAKAQGEKAKFRGLGRLGRAPAVAVAKVAGVIASRRSTGQYHLEGLKRGQVLITSSLDHMRKGLLQRADGDVAAALTAMGKGLKELIRAAFRQTGHQDTGKLLRNIQYQVFSKGGKAAVKAAEKEQRALFKASKAASKRRR